MARTRRALVGAATSLWAGTVVGWRVADPAAMPVCRGTLVRVPLEL